MNLEFLPNEIFLDLFDYFDGTDLLRAFYGLNSRFNVLLYKQFRSYRFRFDSISKRYFDLICQQHLPFIVEQVITLRLSNYHDTPEQINLFFSYIPKFRRLTHLRSLTLSYVSSYEILLKILDECQHLSHLTHLKFDSCSFLNSSVDCQLTINQIWSLPKLTHCYFGMNFGINQDLCLPTIISVSLEYVSLFCNELEWNQLNRLLEFTPRLKHLSTWIEDSMNDDYIAHPHPALVRLKICFFSSVDISKMIVFLQNIPNLRHLDVRTRSQLIDGHQWKQIIRNHLPKLKTLRLKMNGSFYNGENIQQEAVNLLDSFRSSFWIAEHQWFVRCITWDRRIHLETRSGASDHYEDMIPESWQSTCPHDNQQEFYNTIASIDNENFFDQSISSDIRLPNIEYLHIKLPINDQLWSIVPNLDKLELLAVSFYTNTFSSQLQTLLDRAPHLQTLRIIQDALLPLQISLFTYTNISIRQLYLANCHHNFDEEECLHLTASPLGIQCEVLSIRVLNRQTIIHLVKNMLNLRALSVKCIDDEDHQQYVLTEHNDDDLVQWLKYQLPSAYSIVRDTQNDRNVLIWI